MTPRPGDLYEIEILTDKLRTDKYLVTEVAATGKFVLRKVHVTKSKISNIRFPPTIILRYFANAVTVTP